MTSGSRWLGRGLAGLFALGVGLGGCGGSASGGSSNGAGGAGGGGGGSGGCEWAGKWYSVGDSFPAGDGCNDCSCHEDGRVACTLAECSGTCEHDGKVYVEGESFPEGDGCNTCMCGPDGTVGCTLIACVEGCLYEGMTFDVGETFPAADGCNTCECVSVGVVACTEEDCGATCTYAGKTYQDGASFDSIDGCNTCTCDGGSVSCTEINCPCDPSKEWYRVYVGSSPQECEVIDYACPENTTHFANACGCGCQQDSSCPEWFDCEAPSPCNPEEIKKQCPYSGIGL